MKGLFCLTVVATSAWIGFPPLGALARDTVERISVSWKLVGNRPDGHFTAQLNLRNEGMEALAADWALYFNACSKLLPESVPDEYTLTHVNGDLYVLRPSDRSNPIGPTTSRQIALEGSPWAINVSDAPSGFYLVLNEQTGPTE